MASKTTKDLDGVVVNTKVLASIFSLTDRRIRQLAEEETISKVGPGRYDLHDSVKKYIAFLRNNEAVTNEDQIRKSNIEDEKLKKAIADRKLSEIALAQKEQKVHSSEDVKTVMNRMLGGFRARLLSIPTKTAPKILGRGTIAEVEAILRDDLHHALHEISDYDHKTFSQVTADE
ncbi:hypothetical protein JCM19037_4603 [Geomicrobium sp. JCM 19037]|uniref:hypothetical protein n=1 Tax=Geomicrobium sp. JCM 19037 TaxID=1460634 RepID=UPI00045F386E|nr:hypothetical protein [Geomicrobium sp. JCM 19037]GAK06049.1 hypothetical protein JCM19037_4603 [Geomicrobium sp. JCM 19037]